MMPKGLTYVTTSGIWIATLVIAFALGRQFPGSPPKEDRKVQVESPATARVPVGAQTVDANENALAALRSDNEALRRKLAAFEEQREQLLTERYALRFKNTVESILEQSRSENVAKSWTAGSPHFFGKAGQSLGSLDERLGLMIDFAVWGENGIEYLTGILTDENRSEEERQLAYDILCWIPSSNALDALLELDCTAPQGQGKPDYIEALARQVTQLPTADLAPHLPTLTRDLLREMSNAGKLDDKETRVTAALAFRHGSTEAMEFVMRPEVWQAPADLLEWADVIHSSNGREFVERVASRHPELDHRQHAQEMLANWERSN